MGDALALLDMAVSLVKTVLELEQAFRDNDVRCTELLERVRIVEEQLQLVRPIAAQHALNLISALEQLVAVLHEVRAFLPDFAKQNWARKWFGANSNAESFDGLNKKLDRAIHGLSFGMCVTLLARVIAAGRFGEPAGAVSPEAADQRAQLQLQGSLPDAIRIVRAVVAGTCTVANAQETSNMLQVVDKVVRHEQQLSFWRATEPSAPEPSAPPRPHSPAGQPPPPAHAPSPPRLAPPSPSQPSSALRQLDRAIAAGNYTAMAGLVKAAGDAAAPLASDIADAMLCDPANTALQQQGCRALAAAYQGPSSREGLHQTNACIAVVAALQQLRHTKDMELLKWGSRAAAATATEQASAPSLVRNLACDALMHALHHHVADSSAAVFFLRAVCALAKGSTEAQTRLGVPAGIAAVLAAMDFQEHGVPSCQDVQRWGLRASAALAARNSDNCARLLKGNVWGAVLQAMQAPSADAQVQAYGAMALAQLAADGAESDLPDGGSNAMKQAWEAVLQAMDRFPRGALVQENGCCALQALARCGAGRGPDVRTRAVTCIDEAARNHPQTAAVVQQAEEARRALCG